jgi:hypothetical protein
LSWQEGLNNPVANDSAGLMITQTFISFILRHEVFIIEVFIVYPSLPPDLMYYLVLMGLLVLMEL